MTQQTAVEWLVKSLSDRMYIHCPDFGHTIIDKLVEQAKEMEKEQSKPEISDQEILEAAAKHFNKEELVEGICINYVLQCAFIDGTKWYKEQLKNK